MMKKLAIVFLAVLLNGALTVSATPLMFVTGHSTLPVQTATPVMSPVAGTYTTAQTVTISDATPSSTIYYTTNGGTPTTSSTVYTGGFSVSSSLTVKAIATATGHTQSAVGSAAYVISLHPGLYVLNGKLYDTNNAPFVIQGVDRHDASVTIEPYAGTNANVNTVRENGGLTASVSASAAAADIANSVVEIIAQCCSAATGLAFNSSSTDADLQSSVTWWVTNESAFAPYMKHIIVNIANEWGPQLSSPYTDWINQYEAAITALRNAGYTCPLMIDADDYATNYPELIAASTAVFNSDPLKNVIFDMHAYNQYGFAGMVISGNYLANLAALSASSGMVFVLGEFGPLHSGGASSVTPAQMIDAANAAGIGWLGWAWDENGDEFQMAVTPGFFTGSPSTASTSSQLTTTWGQQIVPFFLSTAKATDFP